MKRTTIEAIYEFTVRSNSGGDDHAVLLFNDRSMSCDCMGWKMFTQKKKDGWGYRNCAHVRALGQARRGQIVDGHMCALLPGSEAALAYDAVMAGTNRPGDIRVPISAPIATARVSKKSSPVETEVIQGLTRPGRQTTATDDTPSQGLTRPRRTVIID